MQLQLPAMNCFGDLDVSGQMFLNRSCAGKMDDAARVFKDLCRRYKPDLITYNTLVTGYARMVGAAALQGAGLLDANRCCCANRIGPRPYLQRALPARIDS